jgi:hypothetical protein
MNTQTLAFEKLRIHMESRYPENVMRWLYNNWCNKLCCCARASAYNLYITLAPVKADLLCGNGVPPLRETYLHKESISVVLYIASSSFILVGKLLRNPKKERLDWAFTHLDYAHLCEPSRLFENLFPHLLMLWTLSKSQAISRGGHMELLQRELLGLAVRHTNKKAIWKRSLPWWEYAWMKNGTLSSSFEVKVD